VAMTCRYFGLAASCTTPGCIATKPRTWKGCGIGLGGPGESSSGWVSTGCPRRSAINGGIASGSAMRTNSPATACRSTSSSSNRSPLPQPASPPAARAVPRLSRVGGESTTSSWQSTTHSVARLCIYRQCNQKTVIQFVDYVLGRLPFGGCLSSRIPYRRPATSDRGRPRGPRRTADSDVMEHRVRRFWSSCSGGFGAGPWCGVGASATAWLPGHLLWGCVVVESARVGGS